MQHMKSGLQYIATSMLMTMFLVQSVSAGVLDGVGKAKGSGQPECLAKVDSDSNCKNTNASVFQIIANILIYLTGALAVLAILYGGFRYVTSTGDSGRIKQAKDTIMYGVGGLVIALIAFAIVNFVLGAF